MGFVRLGKREKSISIFLLKQLINGLKAINFCLQQKYDALYFIKKERPAIRYNNNDTHEKTDDKFHRIYSHSIKAVNSYANFSVFTNNCSISYMSM